MRGFKTGKAAGAALLETSVVLPLLVLLLFGLIQYGFLFCAHITLQNASAAAGRTAILSGAPDEDAVASAQEAVSPFLDKDLLSIDIDRDLILNGKTVVRVSLEYPYPLFASAFVPGSEDGKFYLRASSTFRPQGG